jgi:hypothetical protein
MSRIRHLSERFAGSLWPGGPGRQEELWATNLLNPGEVQLWRRMSAADRRHAVAVSRRVELALGPGVAQPVLVAALLHDVGKVAAKLGTYGRVVATLAGAATKGQLVMTWTESRGFTRRVGLYLRHAPLGADMLAMAQSDPLTVAWAAEHHLPAERWTVDALLGQALKAADDD